MEEKPQEKSDTKPEENLPKVEEVKKRFVSINDLTSKEFKITQIFSKSKKKTRRNKARSISPSDEFSIKIARI